jgi:hypothetical protein
MTATINDLPLVRAEIFEPLYGMWTAEIEVDSVDDITGALTMTIEGISFSCSVYAPQGNRRAAVESGRWVARVVAGAAGMGQTVAAKNYVGINLRGALDDLMTASGETLDVTDSDATILARPLPRWHRMQGTVGAALAELVDEAATTARFQRDGALKIGAETFAELDFGDDLAPLLSTEPRLRFSVYAPTTPVIRPGVAIDGRSVGYVHTSVSGGQLRQTAWFSDG